MIRVFFKRENRVSSCGNKKKILFFGEQSLLFSNEKGRKKAKKTKKNEFF